MYVSYLFFLSFFLLAWCALVELNDSQFQRECFKSQMKDSADGDEEAMPYDEDYCEALDFALPPTAGWGMGVDRLVMFLNGPQNIKEVLLFPTLRPVAPIGGIRPKAVATEQESVATTSTKTTETEPL